MHKKQNKESEEQNRVEEPEAAYKTIKFFDSFEEMNEYDAKQRASLSHDECLEQVEELRRHVFHQYLLPNDYWPSVSKSFKIVEPYVNKTGQ